MKRFYILVLLLGSVLSGLLTVSAAPVRQQGQVPADWQKGAVLLNFGPDPYRPESQQAIGALAASGANWVALAPIWYMDKRTSNTIYPDEGKASPSDAAVLRSFGWAKQNGLNIMLKPYFDVKDLTWRAEIAPSNVDAWWQSYRAFIFHYADMAASSGVAELTIGTEMISMTRSQYNSRWLQLITDLRARYKGLLTYSANWGKSGGEYQTITWWDKLDYIGISAYFPLALGNDPSEAELVRGWTTFTDAYHDTYHWVDAIAAVQKRYNRPVIFPEIGFGSYPNSAGRWDVTADERVDAEAQRRAYVATLKVWSQQPWFKGLFWWYWDTDPKHVASDTGESPRRKPAAQVVADWFGGVAEPLAGAATVAPSYTQPPTNTPPPTDTAPPTAMPTATPPPVLNLPPDAPLGPAIVSPSPYAGHPAFNPLPPFADQPDAIYLAPTGHSLSGDFLGYWNSHGGLDLFGYPISEPFSEISPTDGKPYIVQWFERNRFELHPELSDEYRVSLGLLGVQLVGDKKSGPFAPATAQPGERYYSETAHSLSSVFFEAWATRGGLPIFGYPISEAFAERSTTDGKVYLVQYFERARFEYHPENLGTPQAVQLGLLGRIVTGR